MKSQLEEINRSADTSLRILVNPNLSDFFFWHFHPELELVYIEGADGTRHVGDHISKYYGSDLVLIGSNIPHLNFDYGVRASYQKIVVHLQPDFLDQALKNTPELSLIRDLFAKSAYGVAFSQEVKSKVGPVLKLLHTKTPFDQFMEILGIFQILASNFGSSLLHEKPVKNPNSLREKERLAMVYAFIDANYHRKISLEEVAELCALTKEAFCRYFKKMTKLTFTEFVNHYRIDVAKKLLLQGATITEACFESGFESISYFNRVFKKVTKSNPLNFKKAYLQAS